MLHDKFHFLLVYENQKLFPTLTLFGKPFDIIILTVINTLPKESFKSLSYHDPWYCEKSRWNTGWNM